MDTDTNSMNKSPNYKELIDKTPAGIIVLRLGEEFEMLYFSKGYVEMMNYTKGEVEHLLYKNVLEFVLTEDRERVKAKILKAVRENKSVIVEYRKRKQNGDILWIRLKGQVIDRENNSAILQCVLMDCTEEKNTEAELIKKESIAIQELQKAKRVFEEEMRYQEATQSDKLLVKVRSNITQNVVESYIAHKNIGISCDNMPYNIGSENLAMTGYTKEQQDKIRHLLDAKRVLEAYAQGDYQYSVDYQRKTHDDKVIWVNTTVKTYADPETGDIKSFMYSYDIDEEMTMKIMVDKMLAIDYEALAVYWPESRHTHIIHAELLGISYHYEDRAKGEFLNEILNHVIPEEREAATREMNIENVYKELEDKEVFVLAYTFFDKGGFYRKKWQFTYMDESRKAIILMCSDITLLFYEQEKSKEELRKALEMAKEANKARASFLSRVSHDMRTPLNAILGFSNFAKTEKNMDVIYDYINKIEESGKYLLSLINDTLDINRMQTDMVKLVPTHIRSKKLLDQVVNATEINAREKGVNFEVRLNNYVDAYVYTDEMRIQQIINNILSNAVKFTPTGGKVVFSVEILRYENNIANVEFVIEDTGIGMGPEFLKKIFLPFEQEDDTIRSNYKGTGLGMAIVKNMVDLLKGEIEVYSEKGEGTKVIVRLPITVTPNYKESRDERKSVDFDGSGIKILVAEDHSLNFEVINKLLSNKKCRVDWALNGQEACDMFYKSEVGEYPIILMDVRMPVMDGLEAVRQIRAMDKEDAKSVKIIMLTANAYEEDREAGFDAGADLYLAKPVNPNELYDALNEYSN